MAEEKNMNDGLVVSHLRMAFGEKPILDGVELRVASGETLAIAGRSGAGKSTLLRCIACLESAHGGTASLDGQQYMADGDSILPPYQIRRRIGLVLQGYNLFPNMTALNNIVFPLIKVRAYSHRRAVTLATEVASMLEIKTVLAQFPNTLSGGQAQRIALARALVLQPRILLLDEITSALDPETAHSLVVAIRKLRDAEALVSEAASQSMGIVLVTHAFRFAETFADRIAFLSGGRLVEEYPAGQFRSHCQHEDAQRYLEFIT